MIQDIGTAPQFASSADSMAGGAGDAIGGGLTSGGADAILGGAGGGAALADVALLAYKGGMPGPYRSHVANFLKGGYASGGKVPALVSPKEVYLSPDKVRAVVEHDADPMLIGEHIPGEDVVKGKNSKKNDFIKKELDEGGVVVPISVTTHKKSSEKSRQFVKKTVAKHMKSPKAGR
jgi:hypothetical protein